MGFGLWSGENEAQISSLSAHKHGGWITFPLLQVTSKHRCYVLEKSVVVGSRFSFFQTRHFLIGWVIFLLGNHFYRHDKPLGSPYTSLARVILAALRKRNILLSADGKDYYHENDGADGSWHGPEPVGPELAHLNRPVASSSWM
ncbi:hypothetical protein DITRI_Ditri05aG0021600 [Diplodiscus trichospermus]